MLVKLFQEWKEDATEVLAVFVRRWCTRFATLLSSACESCQRSQLFHLYQSHKADLTMIFCPGSYQLHQIAICTIPRLVRASRQASRCAQTILQWLVCSSQDKEVVFFFSFSRLYIACQSEDGNLEEFFKYEILPWPPSFSKWAISDKDRRQKADLVKC